MKTRQSRGKSHAFPDIDKVVDAEMPTSVVSFHTTELIQRSKDEHENEVTNSGN